MTNTTANAPLFDPRLALFLIQLGQMTEYFDKRYVKSVKEKKYDPIIEYEIWDEMCIDILKVQGNITKVIGEDVRINTFDKELKTQINGSKNKES
ncbi:MAG: hypothetical protein GX102_13740 [Porphyromonadaceae bacterium]|jgi:hypothetical protein|nr:hypothetical protein [Porphyromonadaceae bacterium]